MSMDDSRYDGASDGLLSEQQLKNMSRHSKEFILGNKEEHISKSDLNKLRDSLDAIFRVAENQNVSAPHRVAAWNTLCAFIDQISQAFHYGSDLINLLNDTLDRSLDLYIQHSSKARPKSCKQLLTTLGSALRCGRTRSGETPDISNGLLHGIVTDEDYLHTKPSLQALAHFLNKEVLSLRSVFSALDELRGSSTSDDANACQVLLSVLLNAIKKVDVGSTVAQVVTVVLDKFSIAQNSSNGPVVVDGSHDSRQAIWASPIEDVIATDQVSVEDLEGHVLPALLKRSLPEYVYFLERQGLHELDNRANGAVIERRGPDMLHNELLYAALRIGKELGLLYEYDGTDIAYTTSSVLIPVRFIAHLLPSSSRQARITGLSLLVTSHAMTRPLPLSSLKLIRCYLHIFFADTDANFRSQVFSLLQKLVDRLRAITMVLGRKAVPHLGAPEHEELPNFEPLEQYKNFMKWLLRFLAGELRPTASYQRHTSALKALSIVARSGLDINVPTQLWSKSALSETQWPFHVSIMTAEIRRLLLDLLLDPFEDVRQVSASILAMYSATQVDEEINARSQTCEALRRAEDLMLSTARADHADGVAHMYALLYKESSNAQVPSITNFPSRSDLVVHLIEKLETMLKIADSNLSEAVHKYPIHGLLTSLRYLIAHKDFDLSPGALLDRLVRSLDLIWSTTKPILCNDAPEGYLPDEIDEISEVSTKDTLSYCWRALKESSLLLETIVSTHMEDREVLLQLGNLSFTQLAELRHRGAFSTVAQTWTTCCVICQAEFSSDDNSPVRPWYERVLKILSTNSQINTRRSAGLPALICGLLISDTTGKLMAQAFDHLSGIATSPVDALATYDGSLPQVHALNCIKDILKSTRLREHSESYLPQSLRLAAHALRQQAWAIRNCGLMLFRAVIDRLLGTSDAHLEDAGATSFRLTVLHHVELLDIVLDLLIVPDRQELGSGTNTSEGVFPALQLLQRMNVPEDKLPAAMTRVLRLTTNISWHIRDKAARTYASLVATDAIETEIEGRLSISILHQNAVHGALACVKYLLRNLRSGPDSHVLTNFGRVQSKVISRVANRLRVCATVLATARHFYHGSQCAVTKAAYVDVLLEMCKIKEGSESSEDESQTLNMFSIVELNIQEELDSTLQTGHADSGNAILRASLSCALGVGMRTELFVLAEADLLTTIQKLGKVDADACSLFFRETHQSNATRSKSDVLLHASLEILTGDFEVDLKCVVQRSLLDTVTENLAVYEKTKLHKTLVEVFRNSSVPLDERSNQLYADQWLQLWFVYVEYAIEFGKVIPGDTDIDLSPWIGLSCDAVAEQGLFSREATAMALSRPRRLWQYLDEVNPLLFCRVCFSVYDLLKDDDEFIRSLASQTASQIVSIDGNPNFDAGLEPNEASKRLIQFMITKWQESAYFVTRACTRAFGLDVDEVLSVAERLQRSGATDNTLFAEEKQNLYIDEAQETKVWSQVLLRVTPAAVPGVLVSRLAHWVLNGLNAFTRKAELSFDGALGWSSKSEVFNVGLQVIYGVHLLLHLAEHGLRLPVRPSTLRLKLSKFSAAAKIADVHPLWQRELNRALPSAILGNLRRCKAVLDTLLN